MEIKYRSARKLKQKYTHKEKKEEEKRYFYAMKKSLKQLNRYSKLFSSNDAPLRWSALTISQFIIYLLQFMAYLQNNKKMP